MIKYAKVINEETGLCEVGLGTNTDFYKSRGMVEQDVEQSEVDNNWYLAEKCPHYTPEEKLQEAKENKYKEAKDKAEEYLDGEALFPVEKDGETYHIEATDGNIAKIGLKATALLIAQNFETKFPWNTKEDTNIMINALEGKAIAEGLGDIQDSVWTVQYNAYVEAIKEATTVEEVEAIEIVYTSEEPSPEPTPEPTEEPTEEPGE